jgi:hypothetical protein
MMLLMGMWISLTKNPIKPMMANPIAVAVAILVNSEMGGKLASELAGISLHNIHQISWCMFLHKQTWSEQI